MTSHITPDNGRIAQLVGDAIVAEFKDPDSALHCVINAQLAARQWNANLNFDQVPFRIDDNFSKAIAVQDEIYGSAVMAARLEKLASSYDICVSGLVRQKFEDHPSIRLVAMGKRYAKITSQPVDSFCVEVDPQQVVDTDLINVVKVSVVVS